jgi:hypothetical protein
LIFINKTIHWGIKLYRWQRKDNRVNIPRKTGLLRIFMIPSSVGLKPKMFVAIHYPLAEANGIDYFPPPADRTDETILAEPVISTTYLYSTFLLVWNHSKYHNL